MKTFNLERLCIIYNIFHTFCLLLFPGSREGRSRDGATNLPQVRLDPQVGKDAPEAPEDTRGPDLGQCLDVQCVQQAV